MENCQIVIFQIQFSSFLYDGNPIQKTTFSCYTSFMNYSKINTNKKVWAVLLNLILQGSQMQCGTSVFATLKTFEPSLRHIIKQFALLYFLQSSLQVMRFLSFRNNDHSCFRCLLILGIASNPPFLPKIEKPQRRYIKPYLCHFSGRKSG